MNVLRRITHWLTPNLSASNPPDSPEKPLPDLAWVDEWVANVRSYIFVRLEDNLLIKRPNQAQKLNESGARILKSLLDGLSIRELLHQISSDPARQQDVARFLTAVRHHLQGDLDPLCTNPAVDIEPFDMTFSDYPVLSEVALTYHCNLRCAFCYAGCNCTTNPTGSTRQMGADDVKTVLDKIFEQAKVPSVSFTGGEPTLVPYLPELIRYARDLGMRVNLITNGTRIDAEYAQRLADSGLNSAQVSLEGVTAATHDQIVNFPGAFVRSVAAVGHLRRTGIHTHTNTTITRTNLPEVGRFPAFVKNELGGDKFSMNLIIPTGSAGLDAEIGVSYSEIGAHLRHIMTESERVGVEFMWYSPVPMCLFNSVAHGLGNKGCSACDGLISIGANGDVLPCASYDDPVGNLLTIDFADIWHNAAAKKYRAKAFSHPRCQKCPDFHICNGACPLYWRQIGYAELEANPVFRALPAI